MTDTWTVAKTSDVKAGDVVRLASGDVLTVSRIESSFMGMPTMIAFIEDTPTRWLKCPQPVDGDIEIQASDS